MKIGIILHPYNEKNPAGLARTIFEFTKGMLEIDHENEYFIFVKGEKPKPELPGENWRFVALESGLFWLDGLSKYPDIDVCIFNTPALPVFYKPKKSIVLALDFAYLILPAESIKDIFLRKITRIYHWLSLKKADAIIAISEATKKDTVNFFGIPESKIKVVYCGYKKIRLVPEKEVQLPPKYFLYVGIIKERKNLLTALRAFALFNKELGDYHFIIAGNGQGEYFNKIKSYLKKEEIEEKVIFLGHSDDRELSYIYKRAEALVFPSLVEGFGYPVLEAMDCGIPVITSKTTSLGEIVNGAGILVDPMNVDEIKSAMEKLAKNPVFREELVNKGKAHAENFSWHKAAKELSEVIYKI